MKSSVPSIDQALDLATQVIQHGGSTVMADRTLSNLIQGYGWKDVSIMWRLDFVLARRTDGGGPQLHMHAIEPVKLDLVRASEALLLSERAAREGLSAAQF